MAQERGKKSICAPGHQRLQDCRKEMYTETKCAAQLSISIPVSSTSCCGANPAAGMRHQRRQAPSAEIMLRATEAINMISSRPSPGSVMLPGGVGLGGGLGAGDGSADAATMARRLLALPKTTAVMAE